MDKNIEIVSIKNKRVQRFCASMCSPAVEQEAEGPLTNLTGRHVHASSQQISQRAVFCNLLLDRDGGGLGKKLKA